MRKLMAAAGLLLILGSAPALAGLKSVRMNFVKDVQAPLSLEKDGIRVLNYRFARETRGSANPLKMLTGSGPTIHFNVTNEGPAPKDFSLAVALFDKSGNLVAAGTSGHAGKLDPGESEEIKLVLEDLNQNVAHAAWLYMSLETRL